MNAPPVDGSRLKAGEFFLATPAMLLVTTFLLLPLLLMFRFSFDRFTAGELLSGAFTFENYTKFFSDAFYQNVLQTTVLVALTTTALCLALALPLGYFISRRPNPRIKSLLIILVILPLLMGNAVRTAGWMVILGDRGVVNTLIVGLGIVPERIAILYTSKAVIIGLTAVLLPFMVITLQSVIEGIDPSLEEAALNLGASPLTTFVKVIIPLAMPGIVAGVVLCLILSMNAYATPVLIGGPKFHMMAPTIYDQITQGSNWPFGSALAFVLMSVTIALTIASTIVVRRVSVR